MTVICILIALSWIIFFAVHGYKNGIKMLKESFQDDLFTIQF